MPTKPSSPIRESMANGGQTNEILDKLVAELTDLISARVSRSLKTIQAITEKRVIIRALREAGGCQKRAAKLLGIKYTTLNYKVKKYKVRIDRTVSDDSHDIPEMPEYDKPEG